MASGGTAVADGLISSSSEEEDEEVDTAPARRRRVRAIRHLVLVREMLDFTHCVQNDPFCALRYSETSNLQPKSRDSNVLNAPNSHQKRPNGSRNPLVAHQLRPSSYEMRFA